MALISNLKTPDDQSFGIRAGAIPFATVDSTSTSTAFTATVPGITELVDGTTVMLKNGVVTSATNFTININGLGAKPCYTNLAAATRDTTIFNINYTMIFVYDSTRVSGGGWICYRGYDANTNTIGYQLRTNSSTMPMKQITYRYRILFTSLDGQGWIPSNTSTSTNATAKRDVNQAVIDPFGEIVYYGTTASVAAGSNPSAAYLWQEYTLTLGYAFNRTGAALVLPYPEPIYIKCAPQAGGGAIIDADDPYVFTLPSTEDGKIYIYLGRTYSATAIEMTMNHPVYYFKDGAIRLWTNASAGGAVNSVNGQTGTVVLDAEDVGALPDDTVIPEAISDLNNDMVYDLGFIQPAANGVFVPTEEQAEDILAMWDKGLCAVTFNDTNFRYWAIKQDLVEMNGVMFKMFSGTWGEAVNNVPKAGTVALGISTRKISGISDGQDIYIGMCAVSVEASVDDIPTTTSQLTNDSGFITSSSVPTKTSDLFNDSGYATVLNVLETGAAQIGIIVVDPTANASTCALYDHNGNPATLAYVVSLMTTQSKALFVEPLNAAQTAFRKYEVDAGDMTNGITLSCESGGYKYQAIVTDSGNGLVGTWTKTQMVTPSDIPTKTSDLTNDSGFVTSDTKVTQTYAAASGYTYWRPLVIGYSSGSAEGFTPSTQTNTTYTFSTLTVQPSSGTIRATTFKGQLSGTIASSTTATTQATTDNSTKVATTAFVKSVLPAGLPSVTSSDNGKVLMVVNGAWAKASLPVYNGGVI